MFFPIGIHPTSKTLGSIPHAQCSEVHAVDVSRSYSVCICFNNKTHSVECHTNRAYTQGDRGHDGNDHRDDRPVYMPCKLNATLHYLLQSPIQALTGPDVE